MGLPAPCAVLRLRLGSAGCYALVLAAALSVLYGILQIGEGLAAPDAHLIAAGDNTSAPPKNNHHQVEHLLLALLVVVVSCRTAGKIFERLGQPAVIGEMAAGIMIGPSCLGRIAPGAMEFLLPHDVLPLLAILAHVGIILFMFLVGLEFDFSTFNPRRHSAIAISHASIVVPFLLGSSLALGLYPILSTADVPFTSFALFVGVSMSVTAFPVLARILRDRCSQDSPLGSMALACAAIDDVTAWCLLATVVGVANAELGTAVRIALFTLLHIAFMVYVVKPILGRSKTGANELATDAVVLILMLLFVSAFVTEWIGTHAVFGAFLFGAIIPKSSTIAHDMHKKLAGPVTVVLLPVFFALAGMRTQIGLISGWENWLLCAAIVFVASLGKFGGTTVAARFCGIQWRESIALGVLMNTRGLMELIVLNIGLDLGLISPRLYAIMVIMALVTTIMTTPILRILGYCRESKEAAAGGANASEPLGSLCVS